MAILAVTEVVGEAESVVFQVKEVGSIILIGNRTIFVGLNFFFW